MPTPGAAAITPRDIGTAIAPPRGFNPGIGQPGFGGAIGQQGTTAIGQQGSGTAIGQQGVGTAIIPQTNAIVIGQPAPLSPPPVSTPSPATGFSPNLPTPTGRGPGTLTNNAAGAVGTTPRPAVPPIAPANGAPPARRR
jgi:hypothetical protein